MIPHGLDEILAYYGDPAGVTANSPAEIEWKGRILKEITLPAPLVLGPGMKQIHLPCHRLVSDELTDILDDIWGAVRSIGCYNFRQSRTSNKLSTHCWAMAVDINAATNQLGTRGDMPLAIIQAFRQRGWRWGGDWQHPDPMHFQRASGY